MSPGQGPIFIVGAMGSGTTLLRLVLDSHERIAIPHETGFMRAYKAHEFAPFKWSGRNWTGRLGWEKKEFREASRQFYDMLFMRYAEQHGKQRWGEKTPLHTWHIDDIVKLFPDAQIVAMVRHPLGSAASNMSRFKTPPAKAARHWSRYVKEIARQCHRHPDRMALLRYEDLVLRPEPVLRELLEWLGEPWSDTVLEHHVVQGGRDHKRIEGRTKADDEIDISRIDKWTRTLPQGRQRWLAKRMRHFPEFYGYAIDDASVLEPLGEPGRYVVTGREIAARVDARPELKILDDPWIAPTERHYDPRTLMILERETYNRLIQPGGVRGMAVEVARRLPDGPRKRALRLGRRVRRRLGLKEARRPVKTR